MKQSDLIRITRLIHAYFEDDPPPFLLMFAGTSDGFISSSIDEISSKLPIDDIFKVLLLEKCTKENKNESTEKNH